MKKSVTFVIMGVTGDLAKLKLIPAIYKLIKLNKLDNFILVGVARSKTSIIEILAESKKNMHAVDEKIWKKIEDSSYYISMDFSRLNDFYRLKELLVECEKKNDLSGNRLFYLSTLSEQFYSITENITKSNIVSDSAGWTRVLYEKPFGNNLKSAKKINKCINEAFNEKNVYRVDHYLGKEIVGNIALLRFTNRVIEPLWNNKHIESVQIIIDEDFGIKNRGRYYDKYGAIKDILQNHGLQILSLIAMESPKMLSGNYIRDKKVEVLNKTKVKEVLLGQYEGYENELNVGKDTKTETFFEAVLEINNKRWKGVKFFVRTGKNLAKKQALVNIKFKKVKCLLTKNCPTESNYLIIRIQPDEGFTFELNSKAIGKEFEIETAKMDYCHACIHGPNTPEAYEVLLTEAIDGEQSLFIRDDEIECQWKIVDAIKKGKVYKYSIGSEGPIEAKNWEKKYNLRWKE